jgi:ABC-type transporter Mla maintaining outer membrane lipid asymmetry ATPase subunit MlaF
MKNMSNKKIYYGIFAALCIVGLAIGIAGATELTRAVKGCTGMYGGMHGFGMGQALSIEDKIAFLESKGIDVTEVRAALQKGDCDTVKTWFTALREEHIGGSMAGHMSGNCTPCIHS